MNSVLIVDATYNYGSWSNASMTGEQIINYIKEHNYEVVPILRITYDNSSRAGATVTPTETEEKSYWIINSVGFGDENAQSIEDLATKKLLYVSGEGRGDDLIISYDTGEISYSEQEIMH